MSSGHFGDSIIVRMPEQITCGVQGVSPCHHNIGDKAQEGRGLKYREEGLILPSREGIYNLLLINVSAGLGRWLIWDNTWLDTDLILDL